MIIKYSLAVLLLLGFYLLGLVLSGKFYEWAYESDTIFFEVREEGMRFMFSVLWFISIPVYFLVLIFVSIVEGLKKFYDKFVLNYD